MYNGTKYVTTFSLNKLSFVPGEAIKITVDCDNLECSCDVKNFKFKLLRKVNYSISGRHNTIEYL